MFYVKSGNNHFCVFSILKWVLFIWRKLGCVENTVYYLTIPIVHFTESPASIVQGNNNNSVKQLSKMRNGITRENSCRHTGADSAHVSEVNTTTAQQELVLANGSKRKHGNFEVGKRITDCYGRNRLRGMRFSMPIQLL